MSDCLHCQINELVRKHIDENETVDLGDVTARVAESSPRWYSPSA
jgi:hypothetical protein